LHRVDLQPLWRNWPQICQFRSNNNCHYAIQGYWTKGHHFRYKRKVHAAWSTNEDVQLAGAQLMLKWPHSGAQLEFSLSSGSTCLTRSFGANP